MNPRLKCGVWTSGLLALALGSAVAISASCGRSGMDCEPGDENCSCFLDDTCSGDLTCVSDVCVSTATGPASGGAGGGIGSTSSGGTTGTTSSGGTTSSTNSGGTCGPVASQCSPIATGACGSCAASCCCSELSACVMNAPCYRVLQCAIACGLTTSCLDNCVASSPSGTSPVLPLYDCMSANCLALCR